MRLELRAQGDKMREYGPAHPLVFSHIPKTAGTSLRGALQEALQPPVMVGGYDTSLFGGYDDIDDIRPSRRQLVHRSPEELAADATFVSGHIAPWTTMQRYPGADHVTVLRLPHVRIMSQWLHSRAVTEFHIRHWGSAAEAFRVGWLPLRDYLEHPMVAPNTDNTITRFLAWPHPLLQKTTFISEEQDEELLGAAFARLAAFAHVNVVENPRFMIEMGEWLGTELQAIRLNERSSVPTRRRPDLATEVDANRSLLDHRSRLDIRVWEHVVRQVLPDADPAALADQAVQQSVERYTAMLARPHRPPLVRRAIEGIYGAGVRFDPRRRASRLRK